MNGAKPCVTPLGFAKLDHSGPPLQDPAEYRSIAGALQYLTWTQPNLSYAVNLVCMFMHYPREQHLQGVKRILIYLKGSSCYGFCFPKTSSSLPIKAFSNVDWICCS